jgi:hypothetical protein
MAINPNERFNRITVGGGRAANRNRTQGSGKLAGTTNPVYKANLARQNSNNNFANLIGAGAGLLTAGKDPGYQAQEYADQQLLSEKVLGLTTPPIKGIGYNNTYNPETGFQSTLTEDNQNLYDQSGDIAGMFSGQIMDYGSGGFEAMEQRRLERMRALTSEDNERRAQQIRERDTNTGASLYQQYYNSRAEGDRLNREDLGFQEAAFGQAMAGGNYLSGQRNAALTDRLNIASPGNTMLTNQLAKLDATSNLTNESASLTAKYDAMAAADKAKRTGKNKFWGSVLEFGGNMIMPGAGTVAKAALYA